VVGQVGLADAVVDPRVEDDRVADGNIGLLGRDVEADAW
jgi:hypothetical protein